MAFDAGSIVAKLKLDSKQFNASVEAAKKQGKGLGTSMAFSAAKVGLVAVALVGMTKTLYDGAKAGGELIELRKSFENLAKGSGNSSEKIVKDVKAITGALTNRQIISAANTLELLGIGMDKTAKMAEIARSAGIALGEDTASMLKLLTSGTASESTVLLKNIGIIINARRENEKYAKTLGTVASKLDDTQKRAAFLGAVLRQGDTIIRKVGAGSVTSTEKVASFGVAMTNLKDELNVIANIALAQPFQNMAEGVRMLAAAIKALQGAKLPPWLSLDNKATAAYMDRMSALKGSPLAGFGKEKPFQQGGMPFGLQGLAGQAQAIIDAEKAELAALFAELLRAINKTVQKAIDSVAPMTPFGSGINYGYGAGPQGPMQWQGSKPTDFQGMQQAQWAGGYENDPGMSHVIDEEGIMRATDAMSELGVQINIVDDLLLGVGNSIENMFYELTIGSGRAGRVFLASMLSSIGAVASNMGDLIIGTSLGMAFIATLAWPAALAIGFALKAMGGVMKGLGSNQVAPMTGVMSPGYGPPDQEDAKGSMTFIIEGDFVGDREWINRLAEKLYIAQRDNNVQVVYSG